MPSRISPSGFKELRDSALFKPLKLGAIHLEHRVMMAPLTRMRAPKESEGVWVPGDMNVEYYSQRASKGGFQLTEACPISRLVRLTVSRKSSQVEANEAVVGLRLSRRSRHFYTKPNCRLEACH
jgi:2,4-dienoyl-CoA reductase-like NADH-dependent reductase (Old Yellow Enzyme family)